MSRVAVVSGGTRGIGAEIARRLALDGYDVVVNGSITEDITDPAAVRRLFGRAGDVDVLVACAGAHAKQRASISDTSDEDIARVIDVNLRGTFHLLREGARRVRSGGSIVTFSSAARHLGVPHQALYNATKAAVEELSAALARELSGRDITVNCLSPGPIATSLFVQRTPRLARDELAARTPLGRIGTPADVASVVSFLAGPHGRWVNGQTIRCAGGLV